MVLFRLVLLRVVAVDKIIVPSRGRIGLAITSRGRIKIPIRPLDVLAGPSPVLGRRGRRASTVDARPLASDRRRIQKPARHRSRSENENFA